MGLLVRWLTDARQLVYLYFLLRERLQLEKQLKMTKGVQRVPILSYLAWRAT
jgi:hypothetical protein